MKFKFIILLISVSIFSSCKKEDTTPQIPSSYYGVYRGSSSCEPIGGSYQPKITVSKKDNYSVWMKFESSPPNGTSLVGKIDDSKVTVENQGTVFGSGTFSGSQLTMSLTIGNYYCTYVTQKVQ